MKNAMQWYWIELRPSLPVGHPKLLHLWQPKLLAGGLVFRTRNVKDSRRMVRDSIELQLSTLVGSKLPPLIEARGTGG